MKQLIYRVDDLKYDNDSCLMYETLFHNANGYLGVRSNLEEGSRDTYDSIRGVYINGFYDLAEMKQAEKLHGLVEEKQTMLNLHDVQGIDLVIDGEYFSMWGGTVSEAYRLVHMEKGFTERMVVWESGGGKKVRIQINRIASYVRPNLFLIDYRVTPLNFSGEIRLISTHAGNVKNYCNPDDPRVAGESFQHLLTETVEETDGRSLLVSRTSKSGLKVCSAVWHKTDRECTRIPEIDGETVRETFCFSGANNQTARFLKYCIFTDSVRQGDVKSEAVRQLAEAENTDLETIYREQEDYLKSFWERSMLEIDGDEELNLALHYNIYQLLQSAGKDSFSNITAKGLSGEGYEGHYFWDTEMYIQPFFVLTNPEISRKLIEFRYLTLDEARNNARILGHKKGAAYPWRTIMGRECSGYFPSGSAAYHISADIAYSVVSYFLLTQDMDFIADKGAEIVLETARLWMDIGTYVNGQFHIHGVTGPDEYTCLVNNNYFTNVNAKHNLYWAYRLYHILKSEGREKELCQKISFKEEEAEEFIRASKAMVLPYSEDLDINAQDDSFLDKKLWDFDGTPREQYPLLLHFHPMHLYRHQVCKQADTVLAHFIFESEADMSTIRKSFDYYEKITTHDSSLSTCIFSIMASRLDLQEKAYGYFGDSAKLDLFNTHHNTKDGIHTANMGGNYMAIVYGFAGLRVKAHGISFSPILPKQWDGYHFRMMFRGSVLEIDVTRKSCRFRLVSGESREITVYGKGYCLLNQIDVSLEGTAAKAVIFDLDGVITDSARYHYEAWKKITDELEIPFDLEFNEKLKGVSREESLELLLAKDPEGRRYSEEEKDKIAECKNKYYTELISQMTQADILPGIREFIRELKDQDIKIGLASVSQNAVTILQRLGLYGEFDYIAYPEKIKRLKPYPDIFLDCADKMGIRPSACVGIEDAKSGILAIKRAGMKAIGVGSPKEMQEADLVTTTDQLNIEIIRKIFF